MQARAHCREEREHRAMGTEGDTGSEAVVKRGESWPARPRSFKFSQGGRREFAGWAGIQQVGPVRQTVPRSRGCAPGLGCPGSVRLGSS